MARRSPAWRRVTSPRVVLYRRALTASATLSIQDTLVSVNTTGGAVALTLPAANSIPAGTIFEAVKTSGVNALSWQPAAGDTVESGGAGVAYSFTFAGVASSRIVSDGVSAWTVLSSTPSTNLGKLGSANAQIAIGASTVTTADFGFGSLLTARVICSIRQGAFDATLTRVQAFGNANGTVTVNGDANATAAVDVAVWVDAR